MKYLPLLISLFVGIVCLQGNGTARPDVFSQENLVAWCIVPFDSEKRSPAERIAMLDRLGISRLAYDWRDEHVAEFEDEILACREYGIEYFAFWGEHPEAFRLFEKHGLKPQIWMMLPEIDGDSQKEKVALAGASLLPLVVKTRRMGCKLGLYNHGGWEGEPENLIAVIEWLRGQVDAEHVGLVYNQHHGHEHISRFKEALGLMLPYLHCLNINGMNSKPDPKILAIGQGEHDLSLLKVIRESDYDGPIGIIGHQSERDVEVVLNENLEGLHSVLNDFRD